MAYMASLPSLSLEAERGERDKRVPPLALPQKRKARVAPIAAQPLLSLSLYRGKGTERERARRVDNGVRGLLALSLVRERAREGGGATRAFLLVPLFRSFCRSLAKEKEKQRSASPPLPHHPRSLSLFLYRGRERKREGKEAAYAIVHLLALSLPL